ncbi:MAG: hypothetical protein PWP47_805 [Synergistaceae bacterium]|jgi:UDP-4-amino-4,6-dideoxy-N-acetyl-beta-L-altrosamine transaminase|nr:hypothetical protein [Synergistaceae bacterium]
MNDRDERFMALALKEAEAAAGRGDVPIAALVVRDGEVLSTGSNRKEKDPTAHAEILALRGAAEAMGSWKLRGCTLYVTVEPCPMCAGALVLARVDRLVYGCADPRAGACGTLYDIVRDSRLNHRCVVRRGVLEGECARLLTNYFLERRKSRFSGGGEERVKEMKFLSYGHQYIDEEDIQAVVGVLRGDWLTQGPSVDAFEKTFAGYVGTRHAVAFANGTAALHGAYFAAGVGPGDEVITSPMTFAATSNAALYLGGTVRFADMDPSTLCLDPKQAREMISSRTKVIAPVSYAGYPADLAAFREAAGECGAVIVEDACHALGARRGKIPVGKEADLTAFSFHPVKHITTGEGGMVTTDSDEYAERLRLFRTHGITKDPSKMEGKPDGPWSTEMQALGFNYRLSDIHAALGLSQMKKLDRFVNRRKEIASLYDGLFSSVPGLEIPPRNEGHAYHLYPLQVPAERRKEFILKLKERSIGGMVHYPPVHLHPYYRKNFGWKQGDFPRAEAFYSREISLPMYYGLTDDDVERVGEEIRRIAEAR